MQFDLFKDIHPAINVYYREENAGNKWSVIQTTEVDSVEEAFKSVGSYLAEQKVKFIGPLMGFIKGGKYAEAKAG